MTGTVNVRKLHGFYTHITYLLPARFKISPPDIRLHKRFKPGGYFLISIQAVKIPDLFRLGIAVCHAHTYLIKVHHRREHIRITLCLCQMLLLGLCDPLKITIGCLDLIYDNLALKVYIFLIFPVVSYLGIRNRERIFRLRQKFKICGFEFGFVSK